MAGSEPVDSLDQYKPTSTKLGVYEVSLTFSGNAGRNIKDLMDWLDVKTPNEVVLRAIALLLSAKGKEILLRDNAGTVESVEV